MRTFALIWHPLPLFTYVCILMGPPPTPSVNVIVECPVLKTELFLSDRNVIQTQNQLGCKQALNYLAKLAKWLRCAVCIYLYGAFDCMLLSCPECQELLAQNRRDIECKFSLKRVRDMIIAYSQMHCTDKYSQRSSIIWSVWLNGWVFVCKLIGSRFESGVVS